MSTVMEEEYSALSFERILSVPSPEPISVCKCLIDSVSSEEVVISERKKLILSTVSRTESYLRERRIPELLRFILTKIIADKSRNPIRYAAVLLDECMLFRAGYGNAPVLYENRHLEAVVKSFDPGQRGWLSPGQVRRAFITLGLTPEDTLDERIPTDVVLNNLRTTQERELLSLLSAGLNMDESIVEYQSTSSF